MPSRVLQGIVVSVKCDKTVVVNVQRRFAHPMYKKIIMRSKKYIAHDPSNFFNSDDKLGKMIKIRECRPISKRKTWEVILGDKFSNDKDVQL